MSNFVVSARKYRPKTFDEVVGQGHVSETLKKALQSEKIAHAYLFCGPRGVGKTTCARILAKVVNCENPKDKHTPCNECNSCLSFEDNASFNIIELDAASNNSVENIRSLIDQVRIQPQKGKYKIFIIDEVHMLSQAAFNAFLKTLEEPPPYVIFIMATTEKHKILPTILSRCQIYDFKRIQASDIVPQLQYILEKENKTAEPEALFVIGQKADGAMRDALSIFDRIASSSGDHIRYKDVAENLNILDYDYFFQVTEALLASNLANCFLQLDEVVHKGFEVDQFIHGLSDHFRNLLMLMHPQTIQLLDVGQELMNRYKSQAELLRKDTIITWLNLANECDIHYSTAKNKRLHVEVCLSKMAYAGMLLSSGSLRSDEKKTELVKEEKVISQNTKESNTDIANKIEETPIISNPIQARPTKEIREGEQEEKLERSSSKLEKDEEEKEVKDIPETKADLLENPALISTLGNFNIPSFDSSSFDNVVKEVEKEEQNRAENQVAITNEEVKASIQHYTETIDSNSIKEVLKIVQIEASEEEIKLFVPSVIAMESVIQQDRLMDELRDKFGKRDLAIPVIIDVAKFPGYSAPVMKSRLTEQEKYESLVSKNPLVIELQKGLDLQPD